MKWLFFYYYTFNTLLNFLFSFFFLLPKFIFIFFLNINLICLYVSRKNIFKIFFFTEIFFLLAVLYLVAHENLNDYGNYLNQFYAQLILGVAASEAALFLGLFSHFYREQLNFKIIQNNLHDDSSLTLYMHLYKTFNIFFKSTDKKIN